MDTNLTQAFMLLAQGMAGIFVVLAVIAILVSVMQKIDNKK